MSRKQLRLSAVGRAWRFSQKPCLLARPDLSIISETEHKAGLCLCKYCTCGSHRCASSSSRHKKALSFVTSYQAAYRGKSGEAVERFQREAYTPNISRMDLETTHQRDFRPFSVERSSTVRPRAETPRMQFAARSSYESDFPNWGAVDKSIEKRPKYPLRISEVKFRGSSTYQQTFKAPETRPQSRTHSQTRNGNFFGSCETVDQSTVQRVFKPYAPSHLSKTAKQPKEEYVRVAASPLHFTSASRADYRPPSAHALDPRLVRKNISMYLS